MTAVHHWHDFDRNHVRDTLLRWAAGIAFILIVHAAAVYAALFWRKVEAGEPSPPAAVMVELAPMAVSEASQVENMVPGPQMQQSPETTPDAPDIPQEAAPPLEQVVEQVVEKLPEVPPAPVQAEVMLPKPEPEKREVKERPKPVERPKKDAKPTRRREAPVTAAAPRSEAPPDRTTAAPSAGASAARSASVADWRGRALAHFRRFGRSQGGNTGRAVVAVSISGSGTVTSASLAGSSGNEILDREAVSMARRASPFPAPPDGRPISFTAPVNFTVR